MSKIDNFSFPTPIAVIILGCFVWSRSMLLESEERGKVRLIRHKIIFAELQPT